MRGSEVQCHSELKVSLGYVAPCLNPLAHIPPHNSKECIYLLGLDCRAQKFNFRLLSPWSRLLDLTQAGLFLLSFLSLLSTPLSLLS